MSSNRKGFYIGSFNRENIVKCPCRDCEMRTKYGDCHGFCPSYLHYSKRVKKVHQTEAKWKRWL